MARIRMIVEEDDKQTEQVFELEGDLDCLDAIEGAVEQFRLEALPQVEQTLLQQAQTRQIQQEKKTLADG